MKHASPQAHVGAPPFRWLGRWLEPRWRALLTWVALAAFSGLMFDLGAVGWLLNGGDRLYRVVSPSIPFAKLGWIFLGNVVLAGTLLLTWFQPIVFRLDRKSLLLWLVIVPSTGAAVVVVVFFLQSSLSSGASIGIPVTAVATLSGFTLVQARTRPWMTLIGGTLAGACASALPIQQGLLWLDHAAVNLIFGAVMLYSTDPLPRGEATSNN